MKENFYISTDKSKLDLDLIHDFLCNRSSWARCIDRGTVEKSIQYSFCFGLFNASGQQVGFARVVTDYTLYAYIMDMFVSESYRALGKMLVQSIVGHKDLLPVKKWMLTTTDAHDLYRPFGFTEIKMPQRLMERRTC